MNILKPEHQPQHPPATTRNPKPKNHTSTSPTTTQKPSKTPILLPKPSKIPTTTTAGLQTTVVSCSFAAGCAGGCTATCPAGYTVVGGGGSAMTQSYCQIQASYPNGNGWYCYTSVDYNLGCAGGTNYCYAVCAK